MLEQGIVGGRPGVADHLVKDDNRFLVKVVGQHLRQDDARSVVAPQESRRPRSPILVDVRMSIVGGGAATDMTPQGAELVAVDMVDPLLEFDCADQVAETKVDKGAKDLLHKHLEV